MNHRWMALAIAPVGAAALAVSPGRTVRLDFDSDQRGTTPAWLRFDVTPGLARGQWVVVPDRKPMSAPNVAVQRANEGAAGQYRFAISLDAKAFLDGRVQAAIAPRNGERIRTAGVVARYRGPGDFLAAAYDFESGEIEIFELHGGKRESLARAKAISKEQGWTTVGLAFDGQALEASVSGRKVLTARNRHSEAGEAGVMTEASTVAAFDDLVIETR